MRFGARGCHDRERVVDARDVCLRGLALRRQPRNRRRIPQSDLAAEGAVAPTLPSPASGVPENDTVVPPILKSAPLIVTLVPPRIDPMNGASDVIVAAATVSLAMDVPQSQELVDDAVS